MAQLMVYNAEGRLAGKVKNRFTSYGFIRAGGKDYFYHKSQVLDGYFDLIGPGMEVEFSPDDNCHKGPQAFRVLPL